MTDTLVVDGRIGPAAESGREIDAATAAARVLTIWEDDVASSRDGTADDDDDDDDDDEDECCCSGACAPRCVLVGSGILGNEDCEQAFSNEEMKEDANCVR